MIATRQVRFTDTLRSHKKQTKRLRHGIFLDELLCDYFGALYGAIRRAQNVEVFKLAMRIALGNLRPAQETVRPGTLDTFAPRNAFHAFARNSRPARISANWTHGRILHGIETTRRTKGT